MNQRSWSSDSEPPSRFSRINWTGSMCGGLVALGLGVSLAGHDRDRRTRADAVCTGLRHLEHVLGGAHATRRLDAELAANELAHELDVLDGCAALAKPRRRLHERRTGELGQRDADDLFFLRERARLEDDFHARRRAALDDLADVLEHGLVVARLHRADVDHHVDLARALAHGLTRFVRFRV